MNAPIVESLAAEIERVRADKDFTLPGLGGCSSVTRSCSTASPGDPVPQPGRLAWNHPLPDGNKRAAWATLLMFIDLNGGSLGSRPTERGEALPLDAHFASSPRRSPNPSLNGSSGRR